MTERNKRFAIIGGTVLVAVLLLLMLRKGAGAGAAAGSDWQLPAVTGPNLGPMTFGGPRTFTIPGLNLGGPNLSMIGACCSDCGQKAPTFDRPIVPVGTTIINEGNIGGSVYNYSLANQTLAGSGCDYSNPNWVCCAFPETCR